MNVNGKTIDFTDLLEKGKDFSTALFGYTLGEGIGKFIQTSVIDKSANPDSLAMKLLKPTTNVALGAVTNLSSNEKFAQTVSIGLGMSGVKQFVEVMKEKRVLNGLFGTGYLGAYDDQIYQEPPKISLDLPALEGADLNVHQDIEATPEPVEYDQEEPYYDEYEEMYT